MCQNCSGESRLKTELACMLASFCFRLDNRAPVQYRMLGNQQCPWQAPLIPLSLFVPGVQVAHGFCSVRQLGQLPHCLAFPPPRLLREVDSWDKLGSCDVFFPHGGRSLPPSVHLHPWDAVDVLLGLPCPL